MTIQYAAQMTSTLVTIKPTTPEAPDAYIALVRLLYAVGQLPIFNVSTEGNGADAHVMAPDKYATACGEGWEDCIGEVIEALRATGIVEVSVEQPREIMVPVFNNQPAN